MPIDKQEGFEGQLLFRFTPDQIAAAKTDPIHKLLYATDIGYYPYASNHYVARPTGSSSNILIHCISGNGWFSIEPEEYTVCEGEFFILPAGTAHKYGSRNGWRIYWLHFEGDLAKEFVARLVGNSFAPKAQPRRELSVVLFRELLKSMSTYMINSTLSYLHFSIWRLLGMYSLHEAFAESVPYGHKGVQEVIAYMKENTSGSLTLNEMADYAKLSVSRFSQLFKEQTGHSPVDFYIRIKLQRAAQLLTSTSLKVQDIATLCGWDNAFYFSRSFKQINGYSPKKYRELYQI